MKEKIFGFLDKQRQNLELHQNEKELMRLLSNFVNDVQFELDQIDDSFQLLNMLSIAEAYLKVLEDVGNDEYYKPYLKFRQMLRQKYRDMETYIQVIKHKYDFDDPEKFRAEVTNTEKGPRLAQTFLQTLRSFREEVKAKEEDRQLTEKQKEEDRIEREKSRAATKDEIKKRFAFAKNEGLQEYDDENASIILKTKHIIDAKFHPEQLPENIPKIEKYRQKMTSEQLKSIQKPLDIKDELAILNKYLSDVREHIIHFESEGNYNHITTYVKEWFGFLETLAETFTETRTLPLKSAIRSAYRDMQDWMRRVEIKYENTAVRNSTEASVDTKQMKAVIEAYESMRQATIRNHENARIWKLIADEEKQFRQAEERIERDKQKREKERQKAQEEEEKARIREEKLKEKERLAAERAAEKERIAAEKAAEKARIEEEKKKETERITSEKAAEQARVETEKKAEQDRLEAEKTAEKAKIAAENAEDEKKLASEQEWVKKETESK
jgi:hypothetical protein